MFEFRSSRADDSEHIYNVTKASVEGLAAQHYSDLTIQGWMGNRTPDSYLEECRNGRITIAELAGNVVGYVDAIPGEIVRLFVRPEYSGRGLGKQLMEIGLTSAKADGHDKILIEATLNAVPFYERFGFRVVRQSTYGSERADFPEIATSIMERSESGADT